jgi:hypothetical protein
VAIATGSFTIPGILMGLKLCGQALDRRRVIPQRTIIAGYLSRGLAGAQVFVWYGCFALSARPTPGGADGG